MKYYVYYEVIALLPIKIIECLGEEHGEQRGLLIIICHILIQTYFLNIRNIFFCSEGISV